MQLILAPITLGFALTGEGIKGKIGWAADFLEALRQQSMDTGSSFVKNACEDAEFASRCSQVKKKIDNAANELADPLNWFAALFKEESGLLALSMRQLLDKVTACSDKVDALEEILDYRQAKRDCENLGLGVCVEQLEKNQVPAKHILPAFRKGFFRLWLDSVMQDCSALKNFRRAKQEKTIQQFCNLDKRQMDIARARVKAKLVNALPSRDRFTSGMDDVHILQREIAKKRRIMPIRKLFNAIPTLITTLKPCLMMSPLSVSLYLESDLFRFDTVIFDEASQVCTENAIGAIFRGKQVIIAGDSKQLPPSNFFASAASGEDFDSDDEDEGNANDIGAFESVLDEACDLPERTLLWHYRSRHEHLIAFSNAKIYQGRLVTFPSSVDRAPDYGVEYCYVPDGFYDRGGRKGNASEAKRVAELVFDHFRRNPDRSLGVIAFGTTQEAAIELAVRKMRLQNQEFEEFFDEDAEAPFFIKSLENVQGDERDTIIFSIGYAKDSNGQMRMQFGPLSQVGGERRLNVAITRAKYNVKLVGSILPTDIVTERVSADGPKLLRSYIEFAIRGPESLESELEVSETQSFDSPFEESVYDYLVREGFKVSTQVGCSGYRIDMAVKHPSLDGKYVLGIECDGATYHSARTARERDRLRQDILENMGWKIYRIWSTDWVKSPQTEQTRLMEAINKAIAEYAETDFNIKGIAAKGVDGPSEIDYEIVEDRESSIEDASNPYGFDEMGEFDVAAMKREHGSRLNLEDCIESLVKLQFPIHKDVVARTLCSVLNKERADKTVKSSIDRTVRRMSTVTLKDDFLYPAQYDRIPAYGRHERRIEEISIDELESAILRVCKYAIGLTKESLIEMTARAYGFKRTGVNVKTAITFAYDNLVTNGTLKEIDDKVLVCE